MTSKPCPCPVGWWCAAAFAPGREPGLFRFMSWFRFARAADGIVLGDGSACHGQHAACPGCKMNLCLRGCGRNLGPYEECKCGPEAEP